MTTPARTSGEQARIAAQLLHAGFPVLEAWDYAATIPAVDADTLAALATVTA